MCLLGSGSRSLGEGVKCWEGQQGEGRVVRGGCGWRVLSGRSGGRARCWVLGRAGLGGVLGIWRVFGKLPGCWERGWDRVLGGQ